ncbi:MAG: hypothetical protein NC328_03270 [Muribaculum sp.]|nr:hypothetical protein [Muribaculum sp.]
MTSQIEIICKAKELELLANYFGTLTKEAAIDRPEYIGEYSKDLPPKIEAEYRCFLEEIWKGYSDEPLVLEEQNLRNHMTEENREAIDAAFKDASRRTLWERITNSNHEDVTYYKGLLREYTLNLLMVMRHDFLEEITGNHINCKDFPDDRTINAESKIYRISN